MQGSSGFGRPALQARRRGQAVLEAMLVFATYAAAAFILVGASRDALSSLESEGTGRVAPLSAASLACVALGSYALRSSTASMGFSFSKTMAGLNLSKEIQAVQCPVKISGAENAIVSDLSGGVPTS